MLDFLHLPTLFFTIILVMSTAATVMTLVGLTQRTYHGYWWWVLAQWLNLGSALTLLLSKEWPWALPCSVLLSLQWPITMLKGLRRFYVRSEFPVPEHADKALVLIGTSWWFYEWVTYPQDPSHRVIAFTLSSMTCYFFAAWMIFSIRERAQSVLLKMLMAFMLIAVVVQIPRLYIAFDSNVSTSKELLDVTKHSYLLIAMMVAVIFAVYMGMLLTYERTEQELVESQRQLRSMVDLDMLTQLPNRRHFMDLAQQTMRLAPPNSCTLMTINIAGFKSYNETYGHEAGDSALRLISSAAKQLLRGRDLVGRLGGDQFLIFLPETSMQDAMHVAARLRNQVEQMQARSGRSHVRLNMALVPILENAQIDQLMQRLTEALTESQHLGNDRIIQINAINGAVVGFNAAANNSSLSQG
jgi:diguanylate cyclase